MLGVPDGTRVVRDGAARVGMLRLAQQEVGLTLGHDANGLPVLCLRGPGPSWQSRAWVLHSRAGRDEQISSDNLLIGLMSVAGAVSL